jgi:hypothetical protein
VIMLKCRAQLQFLKQESVNIKSEAGGGDPKVLDGIREAISSHQELLQKLMEIVQEDLHDVEAFKKITV